MGSVVDAESGLPLPGARVVLSPLPTGVMPTPGAPFVTADRALTTDSLGAWRFVALAPGEYALHIQRMGYRPVTLELTLRAGGGRSALSVGLAVVPVRLQAVEVRVLAGGAAAPETARAGGPGGRVAVERLRQERYLSADVRAFTRSDAQESMTLAESDLFRALQRLPGVEARDGYSAGLLTRGARGDGTRVYFDGLPLVDPMHMHGSLTSIATDAVSTAFLHPGVRPASLGEGGAAVVDLRSRAGSSDTLHGSVQVTQVGARAAADRRASSGNWAWMLAAQRSYFSSQFSDVRWATLLPPQSSFGPTSFFDVAGRGDRRLGAHAALEVSALLAGDRALLGYPYAASIIGGFPFDSLYPSGRSQSRTSRGNAAVRATLVASLPAALVGRFTIGESRYSSAIRQPAGVAIADSLVSPLDVPMRMTLTHALAAVTVEPGQPAGDSTSSSTMPRWSAGLDVVERDARFTGPAQQLFAFNRVAADTLVGGSLAALALWGERRWRPLQRLDVETGARVESGSAIRDATSVLVAPRVATRYRLSPTTTLSAAAGRAYQYEQGLPSRSLGGTGALYPTRLWLLASHDVPALRTDVATLGAERWLDGRWLASATAYVRTGAGLVTADPRPGPLAGRTDPLFVIGDEHARGFELAARRFEGRWTTSLAYSYTRAEVDALGLRFTSPYERRHSVEASSMLRLRPSLRLGATLAQSSGAPYTRIFLAGPEARSELPYAERKPGGTTADVLVDWTHAFRTWQLGAFVQVHGTFYRPESVLYGGSYDMCYFASVDGCALHDGGNTPYPLVPVFGVRVSF